MPKLNEYAISMDEHDLYQRTPKAVWAAIAISYASNGGDMVGEFETVRNLLAEWRALHNAGIVPQQPPVIVPSEERIR